MITIRKSSDRGFFDHGWLKTHHSFSFGDYHDAQHMGFGPLRVINEDFIAPGRGFGTHGHQNMEIISYVVAGNLAHKDSMGNGSNIPAGEVQYMSAGRGVTHSEHNHDQTGWTHLLQIWILPAEKNSPPRYDQRVFSAAQKQNQLCCLASPLGSNDSIAIRQDANLFASILDEKISLTHSFAKTRIGWIQVIAGALQVNDTILHTGDGAAVSEEAQVALMSLSPTSEFLLFDLSQ